MAEREENNEAVSAAGGVEPLMLRVPQACKVLGVSRSRLFILLKEGKLTGLYPGPRQLRISMAECKEYVKRLAAEAKQAS